MKRNISSIRVNSIEVSDANLPQMFIPIKYDVIDAMLVSILSKHPEVSDALIQDNKIRAETVPILLDNIISFSKQWE